MLVAVAVAGLLLGRLAQVEMVAAGRAAAMVATQLALLEPLIQAAAVVVQAETPQAVLVGLALLFCPFQQLTILERLQVRQR